MALEMKKGWYKTKENRVGAPDTEPEGTLEFSMHRAILANIPAVTWLADDKGRTIFISSNIQKIYGYIQEEIYEAGEALWFGRIHPDDVKQVRQAFESLCTMNQPYDVEYRIQRKDGQWIWLHDRVIGTYEIDGLLHVYGLFSDITERKRGEEALQRAKEEYHRIFEDAVVGIFQSTPEGNLLVVNQAFAHMHGYESPEEMVARATDIAHQFYVDPNKWEEFKRRIEETGIVQNFEYQAYRKDGRKIWVSENARPIRDPSGAVVFYEGTVADITERKVLEEELRQAQKMEAVGRLAGGVAHEFNNLLLGIRGYSELLLQQLNQTDPIYRYVEEVHQAADRAASLTRQLLTFSRRQVLESVVVDLNALVADSYKMLRPLIGEDIELDFVKDPELGRAKLDPSQIQQVIINLAVNARDAMPQGGKLTIETANIELDEALACRQPGLTAGRYVMLAVSDTGCGIDTDTRSHIFEPFFTTKGSGKGTGLGLATTYGIVDQSGGHILVDSEPGRGTTFRIYLPRVEEAVKVATPAEAVALPFPGSETILLAEDEEIVRKVASQFLEKNGYRVLEAKDAAEAGELCEREEGPIHLLLTDVVMPGMSGPQLAQCLRAKRPKMRVLYISGYADSPVVHKTVFEPGVAFLQKPFTLDALARKVRQVLDAKRKRKKR